MLISASAASIASAQGQGSVKANIKATTSVGDNSLKANVNANIKGQTSGTTTNGTTTNNGKGNNNANATSTVKGNATSTQAKVQGQLNAEAHRSTVATFVHSLLSIADRDGGIGAQVRVVAQKQNDSASTTAAAMTKIENRGKLTSFLFGTDYKSLGELRSELSTTSANITHLRDLLANATSDAIKAELTAQIQALEDIQAKIEAFIDAHESSFSLFGWFTKQFAR